MEILLATSSAKTAVLLGFLKMEEEVRLGLGRLNAYPACQMASCGNAEFRGISTRPGGIDPDRLKRSAEFDKTHRRLRERSALL